MLVTSMVHRASPAIHTVCVDYHSFLLEPPHVTSGPDCAPLYLAL